MAESMSAGESTIAALMTQAEAEASQPRVTVVLPPGLKGGPLAPGPENGRSDT